jgi:protein KRI1
MAPYRADEDKKGKSKKRLKELRDSIKDRKWGVEVDEVDAAEVGREKKKVKKWSEETGRTKEGEEKVAGVKRVGKKERERRKKAAAAEEGAASVEATVE